MLRAVIFDFGGTLAFERDPDGLRAARADVVRQLCAHLADPATIDRAWCKALEALVRAEHRGLAVDARWAAGRVLEVLGASEQSSVEALATALIDPAAHPQALEAVPGAHDVLHLLCERGIDCGLLSNTGLSSGAHNRAWLHSVELAAAFVEGAVLFSDELGLAKPDGAAFDACLAQLGHPAEQVVHVGDHDWFDIEGAHRAGLRAIRFTGCATAPVADSTADAEVDTFAALVDLFDLL